MQMINEQNFKSKNSSCWKRRTRIEKWLILMLVMVMALLAIILAIKISRGDSDQAGKYDICLTPSCVKTAAQVLEKVDLNINPCEDFYRFACGNFIRNTVLPDYKTGITSFTTVADMVDARMRTLLEKPITPTDERPFVLVKSIYQACMNTTEIEAHSLSEIKRLMKEAGGWPVVQGAEWTLVHENWEPYSYKFMKLGFAVDMFFQVDVLTDVANSSRKILTLDQPFGVGFNKLMRRGFNETIVQKYYQYAINMAVAFGATKERARREMREVVELEIEITRIMLRPEEMRNSSLQNNPMTIKELEDLWNLRWLRFFNQMLHPIKTMTHDDIVTVTVPIYFTKLKYLLLQTDDRTLVNFMYWKALKELIRFLGDDIRNIKLEFTKIVSGRSESEPRWRECIDQAIQLYPASSALYIKNFFNKAAKDTMVEMVANIRSQFMEILKNVDWMDEVTRQRAIKKAQSMHVHMAYPDELLDQQKINDYYRNLSVTPSNYLGSMLNVTIFDKQIQYAELDGIVDKNDWRNHAYAIITNAFYNENENSIEFPVGILQGAFFNNDRPQYLNYGAIGYIIGHEITHGFDDQGRQFDEQGNLADWWQPKTKTAFEAKAQCIIDQYSNITVPEINLNLNGINTQGENIADNGGIKEAYLAYKKWSSEHDAELALPGLPFTANQMFWISAGNTWCEVQRPQQLKIDVMSQFHAPGYFRVNVPLTNSEYFAKDFNCPIGSKMNPTEKCVVW